MKNRLKFALVGCGRICSKHADALLTHLKDRTELVAVCDAVPEKAAAVGKKYKLPFYGSYDKMLKEHQVDVVSILTESGNHARHTIDIVKKYKNTLWWKNPWL